MKRFYYSLLFICSFVTLPALSQTNQAPFFNNGDSQRVHVCRSSSAVSIDGLLPVIDSNVGQRLTWSLVTAPTHGAATISFTDTATGGLVTPSGLIYTPTAGFYGTDTFAVMVADDSMAMDTTIIYVFTDTLPSGVVITGRSIVCATDTAQLTASEIGGVWRTEVAGIATVNATGLVTGLAAGADTVVYSITNSCGTYSTLYPLVVNPAAVAGVITGGRALCLGDTQLLASSVVGGYWLSADTSIASVSALGLVRAVATGTDTIVYVITNSCGSDTALVSLPIQAPLSAAITGGSVVCVGDTLVLSGTPVGGSWLATSPSVATVTTAGVVRGLLAGADTILYTISNACGADTAYRTVTVNARLVAGTITGYDSVCMGSTIRLTTTGDRGGRWTSSSSFFASVDTGGNVRGNLRGSATISYTASNSCGSSVATHKVDVNITAQPIIGETTLCSFNTTPSLLFELTPFGTWSSSNLLSVVVFSGAMIGLLPGFSTITYTVNNACGRSTATLDVEVINCETALETIATATEPKVFPNPSTGLFSLELPAGDTYEVTLTNVMGNTLQAFTTAGGKTISLEVLTPGMYQLKAVTNSHVWSTRVSVMK